MFPTGTLVHTKEGLKPIEEIKVGDYVLSKPESGEGELAYKRVTKTFVHEDREVFGLNYMYQDKEEFLVTTAEHPFWVSTLWVTDPSKKWGGMEIPHGKWMTAQEMFVSKKDYFENKGNFVGCFLSTYDNQQLSSGDSFPIIKIPHSKDYQPYGYTPLNTGVLWRPSPVNQMEKMGRGVDFRTNPPQMLVHKLDYDVKNRNNDKASWIEGSIEYYTRGYQPKLCTVYNLEVEDYHNYFVAEAGVWVHNTCAETVHIEISIANQTLSLFDHHNGVKAHFSISTATNGAGCDKNSGCTPLGAHIIRAKIGASAPVNAVFLSRRPTGEICTPELMAAFPNRDWILTRILWLSGTEIGKNRLGNVDSMQRYIYIHGTPDSEPIGEPRSHGCVRMRNVDVVALFDAVDVGTRVVIK